MIEQLFFAFWFFAPVGIAILAAFYSGKSKQLRKYSYPVDGYKTFRGKRIFGSHKTVRGFIVGILAATIIVYLQVLAYQMSPILQDLIRLDYTTLDPLLFGFLSGFGALAGDAIKSFFKRQIGIAPGKSWFPFDQIDHILGGIVFTWFYIQLTIVDYVLILVIWFLIHPLSTFIGYLFKLKKTPL